MRVSHGYLTNVWIRLLVPLAFLTLILLNSISAKSPFIGVPASLVLIYVSSAATGEIFFPHEKRFLKQMLGLASFISVIALLGVFLILIARYTETISIVSFAAIVFGICLFSAFRRGENTQDEHKQVKGPEDRKLKSYLLVSPFLLLTATAFYTLILSRTGQGQISVWQYIPDFFLPVFFLASLSLVIILLFTRIHVWLKLALISVYSFLSHSLFLIVWYPGRYGDPWTYLGNARFIDRTGAFYAYEWLYSQRLIADIVKYQTQYSLVALFRRIFSLDIYWVHIFLIPLLWSVLAPLFAYKIAELLSAKETRTFPILSAVGVSLFSTLIYAGAVSTAFSLGLLLLLFVTMLLLYWVDTRNKRILLLSFLATIAAFFAHPAVGVFAFSFFFAAIVTQSRLHSVLKTAFFILILAVYPYVSYLEGATFSMEGLLRPWNFISFESVIANLLLVFGFLGLVFGIKGKVVKGKNAAILSIFYLIGAASYYIGMYGMNGAVVPDRLPSVLDLLLIPFVALGLMVTGRFVRVSLAQMKAGPWKKVGGHRSVSLLIICLFLSSQVAFNLYQAYPRQEITEVQPTAYEVEAVQYIDLTAPARYVVLGDTNLATIAGGFLGIDYSYGTARGNFGFPEWYWWVQHLYLQMITNPSTGILEEALTRSGTAVVYFVVSIREPTYADVVQQVSEELLPPDRVFGDGKLTVFKYPTSIAPTAPSVKVTFDDGTSKNESTSARYVSKSQVYYTVRLFGHSSYNISDYPKHWTLRDLFVNGAPAELDPVNDINTFIYVAGLASGDVLQVTWRANNLYSKVGWKDDSFKYDWQTRPDYPGTISPNIITDGNIMSLSWNFTPGEYQWYYYIKYVSVSTDEYPFVLIRWKSTGPLAYITISYDGGTDERAIVPISSQSDDWTDIVLPLLPGRTTAFVNVGITNYGDNTIAGIQSVSVDYILICGTAT